MKVLFITPHLSTGGGPQYLLKKISSLINECDIYCVEYNDITGGVLVVQRNQIQKLLGDKLITLNENKGELINIINNLRPEVIHFEEMPEYFCDFEVAKNIYSKDRSYKIIETSHDSSFDPQNKIFFPDYFAFVSEYQKKQLSCLNIPTEVVEYPIEYKNKTDRKQALLELGLDPNITHFLNIGLFTHRKNQKEIIDYAKELLNEPVQFHFVGNQADNFKSYWEPLMKDFPSNCKWWGERKDVDTFYNAMDVFLFASKGNDNDKETSPLVLKEAIGWKLPILMYNLPVYCNMYDKYTGISYLKNESKENLNLIKGFVREKLDFHIRYNEAENRVYITFGDNDNLNDKEIRIVLKDNYNYLTNYVFKTKYKIGGNYWISSNANINLFNGLLIEVYNGYDLLYSKEVKDFKRDHKIAPYIKNKLSHDPFDYSAWWSFYEVFIKKEYDLVQKGDIVVDIGANIGLFSLFALSKGVRKIISVEPDKRNCAHLKQNLDQFPEVTIVEEAISDKDGYIEFFTSEVSSINSTIKNDENFSKFTKESIQSYKVPCLSPSSLINKYNITKIDFLKIDCEGGEFAFFENLDTEFLSNKISKIVCEVHAFAGTQKDYETKIKAKLIKCGFEVKEDSNLTLNSTLVFQANKRKKIKIVHLLNNVDSEREKASINSLKQLENFGLSYEQRITPVYTNKPPKENCYRPDQVSETPGAYLLSSGHYGCYLAHKNGVIESLNDDVDAIFLNESDSILQFKPEEMYEKIYEAYDLCIKYDLAYISFGKQIKNYPHKNLENDLYTSEKLVETHCMLIPKSKLEYFKNKFETCPWDTADLWYNNSIKEYQRGIFSRPYSLQYPSLSVIDNKFKDGNILEIENSLLKNFDNLDISVVIQSSDEREFLWKGWFITFINNWAWELGWPVYFCSEEKKLLYCNKYIKSIKSSISKDSSSFSTRVIDILNKVKTKYVLYLRDDMWLDQKVNEQTMLEAFYNIKHFDWNCIKIHNRSWFNYSLSKTNIFANGIRILKQNSDSEYLLSHEASIWNREYLLSVMQPNEDALKNAQLGTERIKNESRNPKIYHCNYNFYLTHGIAKDGALTKYGEQLVKSLITQEENKVKYGSE